MECSQRKWLMRQRYTLTFFVSQYSSMPRCGSSSRCRMDLAYSMRAGLATPTVEPRLPMKSSATWGGRKGDIYTQEEYPEMDLTKSFGVLQCGTLVLSTPDTSNATECATAAHSHLSAASLTQRGWG